MTHLALPPRAHANSENDAEFISDACYALAALPLFELVLLAACADRGHRAWKWERKEACQRAAKEEVEVGNSANSGQENAAVCMGENGEDETRSTFLSRASGSSLNPRL